MLSASLQRAIAIGAFALAPVASAQGQPQPVPCQRALLEAEDRYREQVYVAVAPLVLDCIHHPDSTPAEAERGYRLLTLSYLKQGLLVDARLAIVRLLSTNPQYEPDPLSDLPLYVSLVSAVREHLRPEIGLSQAAEDMEPLRALVLDSPAIPDSPAVSDPAAEAGPLVIDINTATADELDQIPGIGPSIAGRIIDYRIANGPFRSVSEMIAVSGIGPVSLERMTPFLVATPGAAVPPAAADVLAIATRLRINLNTASADELATIDGIGPVLAARIVEFRESHGPFREIEDVTLVSGIGPRKMERMADHVSVE